MQVFTLKKLADLEVWTIVLCNLKIQSCCLKIKTRGPGGEPEAENFQEGEEGAVSEL